MLRSAAPSKRSRSRSLSAASTLMYIQREHACVHAASAVRSGSLADMTAGL